MQLIGVAQEQHPARTRLYLQWRSFDFPVFVDSLNTLPHRVVPVPIGIDEHGIVREPRLKRSEINEFIETEYPDPGVSGSATNDEARTFHELRKQARSSNTVTDWRALGDAYFLRDGNQHLKKSISAYRRALEQRPDSGPVHFRLGVALRRWHETGTPTINAAQEAIRHWERALSINPNQYIWRRRLQQYAPRLDKPYNFYFWIQKARDEIRDRGEEPVSLNVEPRGSEVAPPADPDQAVKPDDIPDPDPNGDIFRDEKPLVRINTISTPVRVQPGSDVRIRVHFRLHSSVEPYWNNEATPLTLSVDLPDGITLNEGSFVHPNDREPETRGDRVLEFEVSVSEDLNKKQVTLPGYAVYNVCENKNGVCRFLRQDLSASFQVDPDAPALK